MRFLIAVFALAGIVVSVLALQVHYSTDTQPCSVNERWDCGIVNHSSFAEVEHVPVAAIGVAGYVVLGVLGWFRRRFLLLLVALGGLGFALRLTFLEEYVLQVWCFYCVISQAIIAAIALLSLGWFTVEYARLSRSARSVET
jgi:uncharacterized membrane protein